MADDAAQDAHTRGVVRDEAAEQRDRAAMQRDQEADVRDQRTLDEPTPTPRRSARDRVAAAEDRGASRHDREDSTSDRIAASADRDLARRLAADHDQSRTRERLHDRDVIAGELHQTIICQIDEVGMLLDGAQSLSRDPALIERVAAAAELLDSAVAHIRRVVFDLEDRGVPQPAGTAAPPLLRSGSEESSADSMRTPAGNGNRSPTAPITLPATSHSPGAARRFVADRLVLWGYRDLSDAVVLMTSELTTNAIVHAGKGFTVEVEDLGDGVRVTVGDSSPDLPITRHVPATTTTGRGMELVEALSSASGATRNGLRNGDRGKAVWFESRGAP